jgi:hypothetical protein
MIIIVIIERAVNGKSEISGSFPLKKGMPDDEKTGRRCEALRFCLLLSINPYKIHQRGLIWIG